MTLNLQKLVLVNNFIFLTMLFYGNILTITCVVSNFIWNRRVMIIMKLFLKLRNTPETYLEEQNLGFLYIDCTTSNSLSFYESSNKMIFYSVFHILSTSAWNIILENQKVITQAMLSAQNQQ